MERRCFNGSRKRRAAVFSRSPISNLSRTFSPPFKTSCAINTALAIRLSDRWTAPLHSTPCVSPPSKRIWWCRRKKSTTPPATINLAQSVSPREGFNRLYRVLRKRYVAGSQVLLHVLWVGGAGEWQDADSAGEGEDHLSYG